MMENRVCKSHVFNWISFRPEERAARESAQLAVAIESIEAEGAKLEIAADIVADCVERHVRVWNEYWSALSRCASSAIAGPANFPVRRAQKANDVSHRRMLQIDSHRKAISKRFERIRYPHGAPGGPIRANDPEAIAKLEHKLAQAIANHELMKAGNAALRKHGDQAAPVLSEMGFGPESIRMVMRRDYGGNLGGFFIANSRARIRALEDRIAGLKKSLAIGSKEVDCGGVKLVQNVEAQRVQLIFPGKPEPSVIKALKSRGFRWAPSAGAWQRHLNNNGIYAANEILKEVA